MIYFEYPYLALLLILPFFIRSFSKVKGGLASAPLRVPFIKDFERIQRAFPLSARSLTHTGKGSVFWFLMLVWALLVLALMRPIKTGDPVRLNHEGRDILLVCDISTSMLLQDLRERFLWKKRPIPCRNMKVVSILTLQMKTERDTNQILQPQYIILRIKPPANSIPIQYSLHPMYSWGRKSNPLTSPKV